VILALLLLMLPSFIGYGYTKSRKKNKTEKRLGLFVMVLLVGAKLKFMVPHMHLPLT